jgi:hypothetical protein
MVTNSESVKVTIELSESQSEGYPISFETLWFDLCGEFYRLKNIPFFIDDLSYDDVISITEASNGHYKIQSVVVESKNSTIWLSVNDEEKVKLYLGKIKKMGCGLETGVLNGYYAINIPQSVDITELYSIIDDGEANDLLIADYPSIRHD